MKIYYILIFILIFSISSFSYEIKLSEGIILSFPRSGNTWLRYCIEYLTKRPMLEYQYYSNMTIIDNHPNKPLGNIFDLDTQYSKPPIYKLHTFSGTLSKKNDLFLIIIVRDYKECYLRQYHTVENVIAHAQDPNNAYITDLHTYHNWPTDKRLLIYYEDLMLNPERTLTILTDFLGEGHQNIDSFLAELEYHKNNCLFLYCNAIAHSFSKGSNIRYHARRVSTEDLVRLDKQFQNYSDLYLKYLQHYEEK